MTSRRNKAESSRLTLRNVRPGQSPEDMAEMAGKVFPCPVCGKGLPVGLTFKNKPYCTCNECVLQIFFRGRLGIERLRELLAKNKFVSGDTSLASDPLALINRLEKLHIQKRDLEEKQGLIIKNEAVSNAISAVEDEITKIEHELEKRADKQGKKK